MKTAVLGQSAGRDFATGRLRDADIYKADDAYRTGWSNGFSSARDDEYARGLQRDPVRWTGRCRARIERRYYLLQTL